MEKNEAGFSLRKRIRRYLPLYILMVPGLIYLVINNYIPMAGIVIAFKRMDYRAGMFGSPWIGLTNFEFLFRTSDAWLITRNTICYNLVFIVLGTVFSVGVAILLNEIRSKIALRTYQMAILFPFTISIVIVSYLVLGFLSTDTGFLNKSVLSLFGAHVDWYSTPKYWPYILVVVNLWKGFGYGSILYFATLLGIDRTYYEAAAIDGAGWGKQLRYITLPFLKSTIVILTLMSISKIFFTDFGLFYQVPLNSGPLIDVTNTIDTYVYRSLITLNDVGMSSAASFYQSFMGFVLVLLANVVVRRIDADSALF